MKNEYSMSISMKRKIYISAFFPFLLLLFCADYKKSFVTFKSQNVNGRVNIE